MSKFLKKIQAKLAEIPVAAVKSPTEKVREGEIVIGTIDDTELRKLFIHRGKLIDGLEAFKQQALHDVIDVVHNMQHNKTLHDPSTCKNCRNKRHFLRLEAELSDVSGLFSASVRAELSDESISKYHDSSTDGIAIRADWQVVLMPSKTDPLCEILSALEEIMVR